MPEAALPPAQGDSGPPALLADLLRRARAGVRRSEPAFTALALLAGLAAGVLTVLQTRIAAALQRLLFDLPAGAHLSNADRLSLSALLVLPLGGLLLGVFNLLLRMRRRAVVDAVEANALHGGRMSLRDSLMLSGQTLISNGSGASVGLEAAFVQMGSSLASLLGRWLSVRRADLRTLVGAGAGAAIAAAFGAPLTGAFYAFELVIGAYSPAALAPVAAACIAATGMARWMGAAPYTVHVEAGNALTTPAYVHYIALSLLCGLLGIALMRLVATVEWGVSRSRIPDSLRPFIGGLLLIPLAAWTPQVLSSGHGALVSDIAAQLTPTTLALLLAAKCLASIISLGFGFRGGLFFASLFLGALAGHTYAEALNAVVGHRLLDPGDASVVGMAALAATVVGGPLTMAMLVLESTHDFVLTGASIAAVVACTMLVRATFGYSFSTWRLHLRGHTVHSARDVGWARLLTASMLMRRGTPVINASMHASEFRRQFRPGATSRVLLIDDAGHYAGILLPAEVYGIEPGDDPPVGQLVRKIPPIITPDTHIVDILQAFDVSHCDELAVVDADGVIQGLLSDAFVRRRYADELEARQRELFGER